MNTKKYKATFVLDTRGYDQDVETLIEKLKGVIASVGGSVESAENLGVKEFSRTPDRKFVSGIFVEVKFDGPVSAPAQIKEKLVRDKTVNRLMVQSA
ncbi:MAG: 30S ribosomal protein S6 [Opitutales bacterium]|nr:30S ribosomal protein S6 [Opitutales bacterium]